MTWARSALGFGVSKVATTARPAETVSDTTSVNDGSATGWPFRRNCTVQTSVLPRVADDAMFAVSVKETELPLVTDFELASKPMLRPGSQDTTFGVTVTARFCRPFRISGETRSGEAVGVARMEPPVAFAIAV